MERSTIKFSERTEEELWTNTTKDDLCAHCIRIVRLKLCIEDITDAGYWKYINTTAFERAQMEQKCLMFYPRVMFEFWFSSPSSTARILLQAACA